MADRAAALDPHVIAALTFAKLQRSPRIRKKYPWLRHTIVCVESDPVSSLHEQTMHHLGELGEGSVACYYPSQHAFVLLAAGSRKYGFSGGISSMDRPSDYTIGQLLEERMSKPNATTPTGRESTVEIERQLALA